MSQTKEETRPLQAFNAVKISHGIEAELIKGNKHEIQITVSGVGLDKVETVVKDRLLEVKMGRGNFRSTSVKVKITYTDLSQIEANNSAKVFVNETIQSQNIKLSAFNSAYLEVEVNGTNLSLEASTNAKIHINGSSKDLSLNAYTNAEIDGQELMVSNAQVKVNTAASATFEVSDSLKGSAGTTGKVTYLGNPKILDVSTSTGGSIEPKN
ncbi:head GIN domain-containing protein [Pararhodonellum marinum]|uniref:head GIN domain-containing protein n=1 Tax=Pararhodonellum marinum TaxID=2755358 RepID=UPI001E4EC69A|nr:head GIN domain-containing protein [Pararhodonellum marinum]